MIYPRKLSAGINILKGIKFEKAHRGTKHSLSISYNI
jgi:hypothetical protein